MQENIALAGQGCYVSKLPVQAFQSDDERRFAVLIDLHNTGVSPWVKPGAGQFRIEYRRGQSYEPDFVVETATEKLIVEIKARRDLENETVQTKRKTVATWIGYTNRHAAANSGKPWRYLLVLHDRMTESTSLRDSLARSPFQQSSRTKMRTYLRVALGKRSQLVSASRRFSTSMCPDIW